jgi:hypothetical protein
MGVQHSIIPSAFSRTSFRTRQDTYDSIVNYTFSPQVLWNNLARAASLKALGVCPSDNQRLTGNISSWDLVALSRGVVWQSKQVSNDQYESTDMVNTVNKKELPITPFSPNFKVLQ